MEQFAKLFDLPETQVLIYKEYDAQTDTTIIHQIAVIDEIRLDLKLENNNKEQDEWAGLIIDRADIEYARSIIDLIKNSFR